MSSVYYKMPLQLGAVMQGNELATCDIAQSITKNLQLIIMTRFGEHRSNPEFGCEIWELDFELIISESMWEEKLRQSLLKSIASHENRLANIDIQVNINEIERFHLLKKQPEVKKRVTIKLTATIQKTGEPFTFDTSLFLSPLSVD
ncbi:GPW/gp25 family protein [soil metagenome]